LTVFETAAKAALPSWQHTFAGTVTYRRGALSVVVTAIRADVQVQTRDIEGAFGFYDSKSFSIKKTDLILNAAQAEPEKNDTITTTDGTVYKYSQDADYKIDTGEYLVPVVEMI